MFCLQQPENSPEATTKKQVSTASRLKLENLTCYPNCTQVLCLFPVKKNDLVVLRLKGYCLLILHQISMPFKFQGYHSSMYNFYLLSHHYAHLINMTKYSILQKHSQHDMLLLAYLSGTIYRNVLKKAIFFYIFTICQYLCSLLQSLYYLAFYLKGLWMGVILHIFNISTWEEEACGFLLRRSCLKKQTKNFFKKVVIIKNDCQI